MQVLMILAINIISGDLIGWNRARNTVFKAQMNRNLKVIPLIGQYNTFRLEKSRPNRRKFNFRQFHRKINKK